METNNPYSTPQSPSQLNSQTQQNLNSSNSIEFTPESMIALLSTKSWLKFIAFTFLFTAFIAIIALIKYQDINIMKYLENIVMKVIIFTIVLSIFIAIFIYQFCGSVKKYNETKSIDSFDSLANNHNKLYAAIVSASIVTVLAFFYLSYYLIAQISDDINEIGDTRMRVHEQSETIQYSEYTETP